MIKKIPCTLVLNLIEVRCKQEYSIILALLLTSTISVKAQNIAINATGSAPSSSAVLDLSAKNGGGFLLPYMSTGQMNSLPSPTNGLLIYDSTAGCIMGYYA